MSYIVHVRKDSATVVPVAKATLDEALAFCLERDVVSVTDAEGRSVAFGPDPGEMELPEVEDAPFGDPAGANPDGE